MYPILFSIGPFSLYSFSFFLVVSWCVWSYLFWKHLKASAAAHPAIFDTMFWITVWGFTVSRIQYVLFHIGQFQSNWLRVFTLWIQPGLGLYFAVLCGVLVSLWFRKSLKVSNGEIFDAWMYSFPPAYAFGLLGSFLDGGVVGVKSSLPWAVRYVGSEGLRHPVQLYTIVAIIILYFGFYFAKKNQKVASYFRIPGNTSVWMGLFLSLILFLIALLTNRVVYLRLVSVNQFVCILVFGQCLGALFVVRGGHRIVAGKIQNGNSFIRRKLGGLYARISERFARRHTQTPGS